MDVNEISQLMNVPSRYIYAWARKANVGYGQKLHSPEVKVKCLELYQEHQSCRKVQNLTGVPETTIKTWVDQAALPPSTNYLYPIELREHCIELYFELKDFEEVSRITMVPSKTIWYWVNKVKLMRKVNSYSVEQQQSCLSLVEQGYDVTDIELKLNVEQEVIQFWIKHSKSAKGYSSEVRQQCLELYQAGFTYSQIFELTGVSGASVVLWKNKANLQRPRCYSSTRVKQACLYLYQKMGKSHSEIMAFMKVSKEFLDKVILDAMITH
jgi:transposase-like protein